MGKNNKMHVFIFIDLNIDVNINKHVSIITKNLNRSIEIIKL